MGEQHEIDMARLIASELEPDSPVGRAALEEEGISLSELEQLRELARRLDAAGQVRDEIADEARTLVDPPGADRIGATLAGLAGASGRAPASMRRLPTWLLTAAALLLLLPLAVHLATRLDPGGEQRMGDGPVRISAVSVEGGAYGPIEFAVEGALTGAELHLRVYAVDGAASGTLLHEYLLVRESPWSQPEAQREWPDRVQVQLVASMLGREPISSPRLSLSRR